MKTLGHYIVLGTAKSISEEKKESKGDRNTTWLLILKDRVKKKNQVFYKPNYQMVSKSKSNFNIISISYASE